MKISLKIAFLFLILFIGIISYTGQVQAQIELQGDAIVGGRLYDNWLNAADFPVPEADHPLWETQQINSKRGEITWLCTTCHGWDYKGVDGAYGVESGFYTGFLGTTGAIGESQAEVIAWLDGSNNPDHDFSIYLSNQRISDLSAFLLTKQVDLALMYNNQTLDALGDISHGENLYNATCKECHGTKGRPNNTVESYEKPIIGDFAKFEPWKLVHKVRFGHPGTNMPAYEDNGWILQDIADVLTYSQTLPTTIVPPENPAVIEKVLFVQADTTEIINAALAIVVVIFAGLGWTEIRKRI